MARFTATFIAICMIAISGSLGFVLHLRFGFVLGEAAAVGLGSLVLMVVIHFHSLRARDREYAARRVSQLAEQVDGLAQGIANTENRVAALEKHREEESEENGEADRAMQDTLAEIEILGGLVKQLAEAVSEMDHKLLKAKIAPPETESVQPEPEPEKATARPAKPKPERRLIKELPETGSRFAKMHDDALRPLVHDAIRSKRLEIFLQPIVTLPQRRNAYHEALARLRTEDGDTIAPADFLRIAEPDGLMAAIDNQMLLRGVQVIRHMVSRNSRTALFCNVSPNSLSDARFFNQFFEFMERNADLADNMVFEFPQRGYAELGPVELEGLDALHELGFRLSMDRIVDPKLNLQRLADRGFRFAKISAPAILDPAFDFGGDIHRSDLASLFARHGITMIVDRVERESQVVDILDYEIEYGQGKLFADPRPVRTETLQDASGSAGQAAAE